MEMVMYYSLYIVCEFDILKFDQTYTCTLKMLLLMTVFFFTYCILITHETISEIVSSPNKKYAIYSYDYIENFFVKTIICPVQRHYVSTKYNDIENALNALKSHNSYKSRRIKMVG